MSTHILIIGGGISGLAFAHRLDELSRQSGLPLKITLLEERGQLGGVIQSFREKGLLMEAGPDSFISIKPQALELCRRLSLRGELLQTNPENQRSFILNRGRLQPVPKGFYLLAPTEIKTLIRLPFVGWLSKLRMGCDLFIPRRSKRQKHKDESVASFVRRRLGSGALKRIAQPMIAGIYSADPEKLSLRATFPHLEQMEQEHGSLIRALAARGKAQQDQTKEASGPRYSMFVSLRNGLDLLVKTLVQRLPSADFRTGTRVQSLRRNTQERWIAATDTGEEFEADAVCLAVPSVRAAELLAPLDTALSAELEGIPYASVATVNLVFDRNDIAHPLDGFGFVIPRVEGKRLVGVSFSSIKFEGRAPAGQALLRAYLGGAGDEGICDLDDKEMVSLVCAELKEILGLKAQPLMTRVARWPGSMPQYHVGHLERVDRIEKLAALHPGLVLTGSAYRGGGVPDCVGHAEKAAEELIQQMSLCEMGIGRP
ncbi:MAG: protoporphyrinogen oxidase [Candidatus Omnitrophica bacterium]|nr:protoporphyrinogen oxidase [Candidatus Omnitrophota bacterium]